MNTLVRKKWYLPWHFKTIAQCLLSKGSHHNDFILPTTIMGHLGVVLHHNPLSLLHSSPAKSSLETINRDSHSNFPLLPPLLPQSCWNQDKANLYYITEQTPFSVNHLLGSLPLLEPKAVNSVVFVWWVLLKKLGQKKKKMKFPLHLFPRVNTGQWLEAPLQPGSTRSVNETLPYTQMNLRIPHLAASPHIPLLPAHTPAFPSSFLYPHPAFFFFFQFPLPHCVFV